MNANEMLSLGLIGVGATAAADLWTLVRKRLFGIVLPNYRFFGRWVAHLARGRLRHDAIAKAPLIHGEAAIGWIAHYAIGIGFACLMPLIWGSEWIAQPTLLPALLVGIATVAAPSLIMQPAMGSGFAASRTPRPNSARIQSLVMHVIFGLGLYLAATCSARANGISVLGMSAANALPANKSIATTGMRIAMTASSRE